MKSERLLRAQDVSIMCGVHLIYVYDMARRGELKAVRIGKRGIRFKESDVLRWMNGKRKA